MKKILVIASALLFAISAEAQIKRNEPKSGPEPKVNIQKPKEFKLSNGLKVLVVEDNKLPRVSYSLSVDLPPYFEGKKAGVSSLTSAVLGNGTTKTSKEKFNEEIDFMGASIRIGSTSAFGGGLSKYSSRILELMAEGVLYPLFSQEEFDKVKAQTLEGLKANEKSASAIASRVQSALLYGKNHAYGEFETEETVNSVTLEDIKKYHSDFFVPEKAYLVVIGDVKFEEVKSQVEKLFGNWKKKSAPKQKLAEAKNVAKTQIDFVDVPNAVQSEIALLNLVDLKMNDKDLFPIMMANQILGGGGEGRLFLNLREAHGWTYGAYSSIGPSRYISNFSASASVRNSVTDSAIVEFTNEINRIRKELVSKEELELAKAKYIGSFVMNTAKSGTIARFALNLEIENLPKDFYENYIKNIQAVTAQDIKRVANKYIKADNMRIVVVGKGSDVLPSLEALAKEKGYKINYYDRYATPVAKPTEKKVDANVTVKSVLENYIKAIGGESKVKGVKTTYIVGKTQQQGMEIVVNIKQTKDGKALILASIPAMGMEMMKTVITPTYGYVSAQGQRKDFTQEELKETQKGMIMFEELEMIKNPEKYQLAGIEQFADEDAYVIKNGEITLYYSVKTGLKLGKSVTVEVPGQGSQVVSDVEGDYKEVKGVKYPHKMTLMGMEFTITELKINEGVSDADFQ